MCLKIIFYDYSLQNSKWDIYIFLIKDFYRLSAVNIFFRIITKEYKISAVNILNKSWWLSAVNILNKFWWLLAVNIFFSYNSKD